MQTYRAFYKKGQVVPLDTLIIPDGSELIITVLEPKKEQKVRETTIGHEFVSLLAGAAEEDKKLRLEWLERLHIAVDLAEDETFPFIQRSTVMQEPLVMND